MDIRKITKPQYPYNNFDKKVYIFDEKKIEIQWWINNIDNACQHIVTSNPDIWQIQRCKSHRVGNYEHYTPTKRSVL